MRETEEGVEGIVKSDKKLAPKRTVEQALDDLAIVMDIMVEGHTDPMTVRMELRKLGYDWSLNKVYRSIKIANSYIDKIAKDTKKIADQRFMLINKAEAVEAKSHHTIKDMWCVRKSAEDKLDKGALSELTTAEIDMLDVSRSKIYELETKIMSNILKAQERQSELYGFKHEKELLIKQSTNVTVKYEDSFNQELINKYRTMNVDAEAKTEEIIDAEYSEASVIEQEGESILQALDEE